MKHKTTITIFAILIAVVLLSVVVHRVRISYVPNESSARAIKQGMTRSEVVETLGVMYDDYHRGKYPAVDDIISSMENGTHISVACSWPMSDAPGRFWVGFDANNNAIGTHFETQRW